MSKRKSLILFKNNALTESFKRPNHEDFMTSSELRAKGFSGLRNNSVNGAYEIWVTGEVKATISLAQMAVNPMALSNAYAEVFNLYTVKEMKA